MTKAKKKNSRVLKPESTIKKTGKKNIKQKSSTLKTIAANGGIQKGDLKSKNVCRITFKLPRTAVPDAERVCVVGDFNNWNRSANPMKKSKNGDYTTRLDLERGREYQFRYLIDESKWENDWNADRYVQNPFGNGDNSVVVT
ncbi:MAG: isoamylase early set domain-containing protein [Candidatus Scalindua rubra]|nr:isoamylase early set domain-containing protein [Candidatus Scalindua rubra]TWU38142.1 glycogen branching enzyme [Candidatus Brocadiaceae bacterium S225]